MVSQEDPIFDAMQTVYSTLKALDPTDRPRVLESAISLLDISGITSKDAEGSATEEERADSDEQTETSGEARQFDSLAELFDATGPKSNADKALVAGYWLQVLQGANNFSGFAVNKSLKDLGHRLSNVTTAINSLRSRKPSAVIQISKSGKGKQGRKTYKVTVAGINAVREMIGE